MTHDGTATPAKREFMMSEEQFAKIVEASKPTPAVVIGGTMMPSPQSRANRAWQALGVEMGFDWETAEPSPAGDRYFLAVPQESE